MSNQQADLSRIITATTLVPRRLEVVNYDIGKSPLFMDAIAGCLFEESHDGHTNSWLREGEKCGAVAVEFETGGTEYRVVRNRTQSGKETLAFNRRTEGGGWEDCGDSTMKLTQAKIQQTLGMNAEEAVE